jgi:hypothetical protein
MYKFGTQATNTVGCCATDLRQVCYSYFGTYATLSLTSAQG